MCIRDSLLERVAACAAWRQHHPVAELREGEEVPAVQRNLDDLTILDDVADLRVRAKQRWVTGDDDLFAHASRFELKVDGERLPKTQHQPGSNDAPEAGEVGREGVGAGTQ